VNVVFNRIAIDFGEPKYFMKLGRNALAKPVELLAIDLVLGTALAMPHYITGSGVVAENLKRRHEGTLAAVVGTNQHSQTTNAFVPSNHRPLE